MDIHWTTIQSITKESDDVFTYALRLPKDFQTWDEGAHTHFGLKGFNDGERPNRELVRHMSISTLPEEGVIGITTRIPTPRSHFKETLRQLEVGDDVAIFKTHSNVPLRQEGRPIYLLASGVGLATFRPLVQQYVADGTDIPFVHSLTIDATATPLFSDIFVPSERLEVTAVNERAAYYEAVEQLATDERGLFYVVGSDTFLRQTIDVLRRAGRTPDQIVIDKHPSMRDDFFNETAQSM